MAEQEPTLVRATKDERTEVARLQRQLERAQVDVVRKEAFGKYDATAPNEGELNYQDYLDQRPAEGVVRDGDTLRDAESGNFASEVAYGAQKSTNEDYYATVETTSFNGEKYESMGVMQLAKEAATARREGNSARELLVKEALETHLTIDAMKDETESPEEAQARFDSEVTRYEQLVDRFLARPDNNSQRSDQAHAEPVGEGNPSQRTAGEQVTPETAKETLLNGEKVDVQNVFVSPEGEKVAKVKLPDGTIDIVPETSFTFVEKSTAEEPKEPGTYYKGRRVSISSASVNPNPTPEDKALLVVVDVETGEVHEEVNPNDLSYEGVTEPSVPEAAPEIKSDKTDILVDPLWVPEGATIDPAGVPTLVPETPGSSSSEAAAAVAAAVAAGSSQDAAAGKELELYNDTQEQDQDQEQAPKKWWKKAGDLFRPRAGFAFWAPEYEAHRNGRKSKWIDRDIQDSMEEPEKQKKRNTNRRNAMIGAAAIFGVGTAIFAGIQLGNHLSPDESGTSAPGAEQSAGFDDLNLGTQHESTPDAEPTAETVSPELFTPNPGEGGLELFENLGLDSATWYDNARTLLEQYPEDFYLEGTDVRLQHTGLLSQGAQDFINSLRQG